MLERRDATRFDMAGFVGVKTEDQNGPRELKGNLTDLSTGGFCIYCDQPLTVDQLIHFELMPGNAYNSIHGTARVRYIAPLTWRAESLKRVGFQFVDVNPDQINFQLHKVHRQLAEARRKKNGVKPPDFLPF